MGGVGTISGRIVNVNGDGHVDRLRRHVPAQRLRAVRAGRRPTARYTVSNLPSGTYALAFLGCGEGDGDPQPLVRDPQSSVTSYQAVWWNGVPLSLENSEGGPDPMAQGANLVTVQPGQHLTGYDWCFGCTAITITSITPGDGSLTVAFTTSLPPAGAPGGVAPAADARIYTVTCTSSNGGVTGSASGPASPITVTGLTPGATYTCRVAASDGSVTVASSDVSGEVISTSSGASGAGSDPVAKTVAFPTSSASASGGMARTGVSSSAQALVGVASLLLGLILILLTRARRSRAIV